MNASLQYIIKNDISITPLQISLRDAFIDFSIAMRNYIVSSMNGHSDVVAAGKWVETKTKIIARILDDNYSDKPGFKFTKVFNAMLSLISAKIDSVKNGDINTGKLIEFEIILALAIFLDFKRQSLWNGDDFLDSLHLLFDTWLNQILCRAAREWEADLKTLDDVNHVLNHISDIIIKDIFSKSQNHLEVIS